MDKTNPAEFWDHKWESVSDLPQDVPRVEKIFELWPTGVETFLDVGAGDGRITNLVGHRARIKVAQDISRAGLQKVAALRVLGVSDCLPYGDETFDLVLCAETIEHLPGDTLDRTIAELARVSRRYVLITTPFEEHLEAGLVQCDRCVAWFHASLHCQSFTRSRIEALFGRAGLRVRTYASSGVEPYRSALLDRLSRALTGYWGGFWHPQLSCPVCGNPSIQRRRGRGHPLRMFFGGLNLLFGRIFPGKPHNHVVLLEKTDDVRRTPWQAAPEEGTA